jgi:AraC-like DNA-binding protein
MLPSSLTTRRHESMRAMVGAPPVSLEPRTVPRLVRGVFEALVELGIDPAELLVPTARARAPKTDWPAYDFWESLVRITQDQGIGVRLAESVRPSDFGLMGELVSNSGTLGEALLHGVRLSRLNLRGARMSVTTDSENTCVAVRLSRPGVIHPAELDFILASGVLAARSLTANDFAPVELFFPYDQPRDLSHHRRVFRAPVRFGAAQAGCVLATTLLLLPLPNSNAHQRSLLATKADERMAASSADLPQRVRSAILGELRGGTASLRRVATRLGTFPHVINRGLRAFGVSYRDLLARTRLELAEEELQRAGAHVGRISDALGYSNRSAFNRAFKRATGYSPLAYRARMRVETGGLAGTQDQEDPREQPSNRRRSGGCTK